MIAVRKAHARMKRAKKEYFTPSRFANFALAELSYALRLGRCLGGPRLLWIEPANTCNLRCPLCPTGTHTLNRKAAMMAFKDYKKVVDELRDSLVHVYFSGWGEPFLNKDTLAMIDYATRLGLPTDVHTNLLMLDEAGLKGVVEAGLKLIGVSIDGATEETYQKYRVGGNFAGTVDRLKALNRLKLEKDSRFPLVRIQYVVTKHNYLEIPQARQIASEVGADRFVARGVELDRVSKDFERSHADYVAEEFDLYKEAPTGKVWCRYPYAAAFVYADGNLVPCCYISSNQHFFGNVFSYQVKDIWNNRTFRRFRKALMRNPTELAVCGTCLAKYEYL